MRLSITSDELSADLNTALELLHEFPACREMELRRLGLDTLPNVDPRWLDLVEKALHARRFKITALSATWSDDTNGLLALAERFQCGLISISLPDDANEEAPAGFVPFCENAAAKKITVALRNHPESIAATAEEALNLIDQLAQPNLGFDWCPASGMSSGDGTGLEEIDRIAPKLKMLHVRDAIRRGISADWAPLSKGVIPWEDILELLFRANYRGPVVLDLGLPYKIREARTALPLVARWIDACRLRRSDDDERDEENEDDEPRFSSRKPPKRR